MPEHKELANLINGGQTPFSTLKDFIRKFRKKELDEGTLYYEWLEDGDDFFIDLWTNIYEYGGPRGRYENYDDEQWLNILENITAWIVEPE